LAAVGGDGLAIEGAVDPSEKVKLKAVKQNGIAIRLIDNPSEELQLAAVKSNPKAFFNISNPYESIRKYMVEFYPEIEEEYNILASRDKVLKSVWDADLKDSEL
jgi:hypothetical protein